MCSRINISTVFVFYEFIYLFVQFFQFAFDIFSSTQNYQ